MPDSGQNPGGGTRSGESIPRVLLDPSSRSREDLLREIEHLWQLVGCRIDATNARIDAQQVLTDALFKASTENVATAFTAAKEAVGKQEADTTKRIEGLQAMLTTIESGLTQRFEDLKGRMDRGEGKSSGLSSAAGALLAIAGVLVAVVGLALSVFLKP